jgi:nitroreductase/NAD-dependent dihydropyrimidine dehydrogenase PreA subunit
MLDFKIDQTRCTQCKQCARDCPARVITFGEAGFPTLTPDGEQTCIQCQHCLAICPTGAISILGKDPEDSLSIDAAMFPTLEAMQRLIKGRRTTRRYKPTNVPLDTIKQLLDGTSYAPTGANRRKLTFAVIDNRDEMKAIRQQVMESLQTAIDDGQVPEHFGYLHAAVPAYFKYRADLIFRGAPHLLIVSAESGALCPEQDIAISLSTFELLAASAGLGTTWCGMFNMALKAAPDLQSLFKLDGVQHYYAMLFGEPKVKYARTVQREDSVKRVTLTANG